MVNDALPSAQADHGRVHRLLANHLAPFLGSVVLVRELALCGRLKLESISLGPVGCRDQLRGIWFSQSGRFIPQFS